MVQIVHIVKIFLTISNNNIKIYQIRDVRTYINIVNSDIFVLRDRLLDLTAISMSLKENTTQRKKVNGSLRRILILKKNLIHG